MSSSRKSVMLALGAALGILQLCALAKGGKTEDGSAKTTAKEPGTKGAKGPKDPAAPKSSKAPKGKDANDPDAPPKDELGDLPIPNGQPQKGVNIPMRRPNGKMQMNFAAGIATKLDEEHVKFEKLKVTTYQDDGKTEDLNIDLPDAIYNKATKMLSSDVAVKIKRSDFEIEGQNMSFQVVDHTGALGGGVKMTIYNRDSAFEPDKKEKKTSVEFQKPPATPKTPPAAKKDHQ